MDDINLDDPVSVIATLSELRDDEMFDPWSLVMAFSHANEPGGLITIIEEAPPDPPQHERISVIDAVLQTFLHAVRESDVGGVLLAHDRPGSADIRGHDLAWLDALNTVADAAGIRVHGAYVMSDDGVARVVVPEPVQ